MLLLLYTNVLLITQSQSVSNLMSSSDQTDSVPVGIIVFAVVLLIVIGAAGYKVYQKKRGEDGQL